jgi:hypothetical protein
MRSPGTRFATAAALTLSALPTSGALAADAVDQGKVLAAYADIAEAAYEDALLTAKDLQGSIDALLAEPGAATHQAAKEAWLRARVPYQQTEAYRFGNAIVDDWEGRVNAWPLDEGLIDYVAPSYGSESDQNLYYVANVIANPKVFSGGHAIDAAVIDADLLRSLHEIDAIEANVATGYHAILFTSENDFDVGCGVIGVRDANDGYRQIGEFASHGVGPHEVVLMPDGATLVVANGGIRTHPDNERAKLNLDTMQPSLAYIELASGRLRDAFGLAQRLHRLSIRHLAVNRDGLVAAAMQYEGGKRDRVPLVGLHAGGQIRLLDAPPAIERDMRQYAGSVAFDLGGQLLAVSCPRGNLITFWDARTGGLIDRVEVGDGCGVAPAHKPGAFVITGGRGDVLRVEPGRGEATPLVLAGLTASAWDNHLIAAAHGTGVRSSRGSPSWRRTVGAISISIARAVCA